MPLGIVAMFVDVALKGTVLLAVAFLLVRALQNAPAAARHLVWSVALVGVLVIPALSRTIPWKLEVLPEIPSAALVEMLSEEVPASVRATDAEGAEALDGGAPLAGAADTDQAQISSSGSLETERNTRTTTGTGWQFRTVQRLLSWTPLVWLLGVGVLSVRIALSLGAIRWMAWRGVSATPVDWNDELAAARRVLGLTGPVRLVVSRRASIPFTTGLWRPVIVLPPASAAWDRGLRRAVLLHELSHVKRRDVLTHFVSQVGCALYWFHPLVWVAAKRLRVESERACDELVLSSGERPTDYAAHLLSIVREAVQRRTPVLALPMARYAGLEERLDAILEFDGRLRSLSRGGAGLIVAMIVLMVVPLSALAPALDADPELPVPPTDSQVGERFGLQAGSSSLNHTGIDIAAPEGTAVLAAAEGVVSYADWQPGSGYTVEVDHGDDYTSLYVHLGTVQVTVGQPIERGEAVGTVGLSGNTTFPHVHFEVRENGVARFDFEVHENGIVRAPEEFIEEVVTSTPADGVAQTSLTGDWILTLRNNPSPHGPWLFNVDGRLCVSPRSLNTQYRITVVQDGQVLTVTDVARELEPFEMSGSVDETGVRFRWERNYPPRCDPLDFRLTGKVMGDSMSGSVELLVIAQGEWSATRVEEVVRAEEYLRRIEEEQQRLEREIRMVVLSTGVVEVQARAVALALEQRDIEAGMDRLAEEGLGRSAAGTEAGRRLFERKEVMVAEINDLWREIQRLRDEARAVERSEASDRLDDAVKTIEDDKLWERVRYSRGLIGEPDRAYASEFEAETTRVVEELQEELLSVVLRPGDRP